MNRIYIEKTICNIHKKNNTYTYNIQQQYNNTIYNKYVKKI